MTTAARKRRSDPALCDAAADGDLRRVKRMLLEGVDPDSADEDGTTALMASAFAAQTAIVRFLLDAGADPNTQDVSGLSPLMNAVIASGEMDLDGADRLFAEIVEILLDAGADPDLEDQDGLTARDHAEAYDLHLLLELFGGPDPSRQTAF